MANPSKKTTVEKGKSAGFTTHLPHFVVWLYALLAMVFIPAFYYKPAIDVTWVPKFVALSGLMLAAMLWFMMRKQHGIPDFRLFRKAPIFVWAAFVGISLVSLLVASHIPEALFDIYRNLLLLIFLLVTTSVLINYQSIRPFVVMAIVLALGFSTIGLFQYFSHVFRQIDLASLYKINGLMSHKNVFSSVLFLLMPFLTYAILTSRPKECIPAIVALLLTVTLLFLMQTRGIWLATFVFLAIGVILSFVWKKSMVTPMKTRFRRSTLMLGATMLLALLAAGGINHYSVNNPMKEAVYRMQAADVTHQKKIEPLTQRAASIFNTSSPNRVKRIDIWKCSMKLIADNPLLGVGAGNWKVVIPAYYQPDPNEAFYHNWRRPHNDFVWVWAEKGVIGLLAYVAFFVSIFVAGWQVLRKGSSPEDKLLTILMMGGIGGYLVDASFAFPYERMDVQMLMMLPAAVIIWKSQSAKTGQKEPKALFNQRLNLLTALVLSLFLWSGSRIIHAEKYTNYAHYALTQNQWELVIRAIDQTSSSFALLDPVNNPLEWYKGNALFRLERHEEAAVVLEEALRKCPNSVPVLQDLATVYYLQKKYPEALSMLDRALKIYPLNRNALKIKGMVHYYLEEYEAALKCYYLCLSDTPDQNLDLMIRDAKQRLYGGEQQSDAVQPL